MLNLRPLGSTVRLEKQPTKSVAAVSPLGVFTSNRVDVDALLPGERLSEAQAVLHWRQRLKDLHHHAAPDGSIRVSLFAFLFVGLLCAAVIAFASEIRPIDSNSPDYGYDEALTIRMSPPTGGNHVE